MKKIFCYGLDLSCAHGAMVCLRNGKLHRAVFYTEKAGAAKAHKRGQRIALPSSKEMPEQKMRAIVRLAWIDHWLAEDCRMIPKESYAALEDYALRAAHGAHQLGEVGGIARLHLYRQGANFRLHDPIALKMFVAHDGTAQKDLIEHKVKKRWKVDFSDYNPVPTRGGKQDRTTSEDLADAFGLAQMVWTEYQLRMGLIRLSDLHEKEIRVFNRATKANPINILGREWMK